VRRLEQVIAEHVPAYLLRTFVFVAEAQAIGRAHRQGQTKKLVVARFVVLGTIEYELFKRNTL